MLPLSLRAAFLSAQRQIKDRQSHTLFAREKGNAKDYPFLLFSHKAHLYRNYPEPWYTLQRYKVDNLKIACAKTDGTLVRKGETFSFWRIVGSTSSLKGYRKGMSIVNGNLRAATGGGLCQLSNALYWTALHCGCLITERHRHSLDIFPDSKRTVPFGCGATIFYNYMDLRFVQNIFDAIYFRTRLSDEFLFIEAYTAEASGFSWLIEERNHRFERENDSIVRKNEIYRLTLRTQADSRAGNSETAKGGAHAKKAGQSNILIEELVSENYGRVLYDLPESKISDSADITDSSFAHYAASVQSKAPSGKRRSAKKPTAASDSAVPPASFDPPETDSEDTDNRHED